MSVCCSVCRRSVRHNFLKGQEVTLQCFYRSTFYILGPIHWQRQMKCVCYLFYRVSQKSWPFPKNLKTSISSSMSSSGFFLSILTNRHLGRTLYLFWGSVLFVSYWPGSTRGNTLILMHLPVVLVFSLSLELYTHTNTDKVKGLKLVLRKRFL